MVPYKDGKANHGHSCVKGRFAWGYANHQDRILKPMIRAKITDPWREVTWDEAIGHAASEFKRIQAQHGAVRSAASPPRAAPTKRPILVQKLVRAGFGNNNVDTCARVCHSPTGYGLSKTFGTSAGTQDFDSVDEADVIVVIGANPTDAHPVFASRMKKRLREGAKLIVIDPRRIDLVRIAACRGRAIICRCSPAPTSRCSTRWRMSSSPKAWSTRRSSASAATRDAFADWAEFVRRPENSPEAAAQFTGVPAADIRAAARLYADRRQRRDLLRARRHRAQPGLDRGDGASPISRWRPAISAGAASA